MTTFILPDLGEGLQEAEIVSWHVAEGGRVITDQPLVSVETDKAVVEIPSPFSGTVVRLLAQEGDVVPTGGPLAEFSTKQAADQGAIVGEIAPAAPAPARQAAGARAAPPERARVKASPAVRKLAQKRNVDLTAIKGTGRDGAILSPDVMAAAAAGERLRGELLRGVRRAMARAMERSHASVVPATVTETADISAWPEAGNPTLRLIRAIAAACAAEPALNAWFDGERRQLHDHVDLAIAVDTGEGLFAPVLRHVEAGGGTLRQLAEIKAAVKARTIAPDALKDATITLSNFGMIGGEHKAAARRVLPLSLTVDPRAVTGGEAARFLAALRAELERPKAPEAEQRA